MIFADKHKKSSNVATPLPTLRDLAPEWAKVSDKLSELCRRESEILKEIGEIQARIAQQALRNQGPVPSHYFGLGRPKDEAEKVISTSDAANNLLGDLAPPVKVIAPHKHRIEGDAQRIFDLSDELDAVREAIAVIRNVQPGERYSLWERTHLEGSKAYCDMIAPEYAAVARRYLDALIALGAAHMAHERFVKERLTGVAFGSLRPIVPMHELGDPRDKTSPVRAMLDRAVDIGRLEAEAIPPQFTQREQ